MAEPVTSLRVPATSPPVRTCLQPCHFPLAHHLHLCSARTAVSPFPSGRTKAHALETSTTGGCAVSSPTTSNGTGNRLLDRLSRNEYKRLLPRLETISLA